MKIKIKNLISIIILLLNTIIIAKASNHTYFVPQLTIGNPNKTSTAPNYIEFGKPASVSLAVLKNWDIDKKKRFYIGTGLRLTSSYGTNVNLVTALAKLTTGTSSPAAFFTNPIKANFDTVSVNRVQVNSLNATIQLGYNITKKLDVGFTIDAIGLSFGNKQVGKYVEGGNTAVNLKPTLLNVLLVSDNDLGTLNSVLYANYANNNKVKWQLGFGFLFTEYTADKVVQVTNNISNDRFRTKSFGISIGMQYDISDRVKGKKNKKLLGLP
jgi:long-subunit fatty acid transport protein